jgi:hypothetical protein
MLAITERERSADDAQRCGDGRYRAGGVLCCPPLRRRCVSEMDWSDPGFWPTDFAPRLCREGRSVPSCPSVTVLGACPCSSPSSKPAARLACVMSSGTRISPSFGTSRTSVWLQRRWRPSRNRASSCARRRARLVASLRPRAWSARGLRALTAAARSSPDSNCVMAAICISSGSPATPVSGNRSQMRS